MLRNICFDSHVIPDLDSINRPSSLFNLLLSSRNPLTSINHMHHSQHVQVIMENMYHSFIFTTYSYIVSNNEERIALIFLSVLFGVC